MVPRDRHARIQQGNGNKKVDARDRDAFEKDRLAHRRGGHYRYDPPRQEVLPEPGNNSLAYVDELDRFSHNASVAEYEQRQRNIQRKNVRTRHRHPCGCQQLLQRSDQNCDRSHSRTQTSVPARDLLHTQWHLALSVGCLLDSASIPP